MFGMIHLCTIQRRFQKRKLLYTGSSGTPVVGQTLTGVTSTHTATIARLGTGYLVLSACPDDMHVGEVIGHSGFSATAGASSAHDNSSGEPEHYWADNETSVRCRFYSSGARMRSAERGEIIEYQNAITLPSGTAIAPADYRVVSTIPGHVGTWEVVQVIPRYALTGGVIHHYDVILREAE